MYRYTEEEIRTLYREAKNKRKEINILCQLTLLSRKRVLEIIGDEPPECRKYTRLDTDKADALFRAGYSDFEIASMCNVVVRTVRNWRHREGLMRNN